MSCLKASKRKKAIMPDVRLVVAAEMQSNGNNVHVVQALLHRYADACERGQKSFAETCERLLRSELVTSAEERFQTDSPKECYLYLWDKLLYQEHGEPRED